MSRSCWTRSRRLLDVKGLVGRAGSGHFMVLLDRGDQWLVGYGIPKGGIFPGASMCVNMVLNMIATSAGSRVPLPVLDCKPLLSGAPIDGPTAARLAAILRVLADPARLRILSLIQSQPTHEACVCHLTDALGLSQPTVSHHLRVLYEAQLLDRERRGNWVYYRALPAALDDLRAALGDTDTRARVAAGSAACSDGRACG